MNKTESCDALYVSHNPKQVLKLCQRGLVLKAGQMAFQGSAEDAVKALGYDLDDDNDES